MPFKNISGNVSQSEIILKIIYGLDRINNLNGSNINFKINLGGKPQNCEFCTMRFVPRTEIQTILPNCIQNY